ncbi:MAG: S8 family serine peptidase [Nanoarchaeota archaeon]|nr:S8 family serine peptidase [Nanoarchaeota archaeon]
MGTKLKFRCLVFGIMVLVLFCVSLSVAEKSVKLMGSSSDLISGVNVSDIVSGDFRRVIADNVDGKDIDFFKRRGCIVRHEMRYSISFECPEGVSDLGVREARVFHVVDLEADEMIGADKVWAEGIDGSGVDVVVLDTGIDSHVELGGSIKGQKDFVDDDDVAEDENGHGTHVAGIISGGGVNLVDGNYATGVSPGAGIYMLKVCDETGSCYEDDIVAGMEYAVDSLDARIMSLSLGNGNYEGDCDEDFLAAKVNWVVENGYSVVVSAGNDGLGVSSPACASKAIAVGAVDKSGNVPTWSNAGSALDILAPGVEILSTYSCEAAGDCGSEWYAHMSGTSMAAPHVSGVIALMLSANPYLSDGEIKDALYDTATDANNCNRCYFRNRWTGECRYQRKVLCSSDIIGAGIVNAYGAYEAVKLDVCVPGLEVCDGRDNDCDGGVDEGLIRGCGVSGVGECSLGLESCSAGGWVGCQAVLPSVEDCDGVDNDCDGSVDEGGICDVGGKCWSGENKYLIRGINDIRKFCKCAAGTYEYRSYSLLYSRGDAYKFDNPYDNDDYGVSVVGNYFFPIVRVQCSDGGWYETDEDYLG